MINGANVINGDIKIGNTSNLVHIIDKAVFPQQESNLLELMEQSPQLSQMSSFLTLSGLQKDFTSTVYNIYRYFLLLNFPFIKFINFFYT